MDERNYNLGKFNERVTFLQPVAIESATSDGNIEYTPVTTRYCEVQDSQLKSETAADAMASVGTLTIYAWLLCGLTTDWRVEYEGEQYTIERIIKEGRQIRRLDVRRVDLCNE